jgi:hypothetical protein
MRRLTLVTVILVVFVVGACQNQTTAAPEKIPDEVVLVWHKIPAWTPNIYVYRDTKTGREYVVFQGTESVAVVVR